MKMTKTLLGLSAASLIAVSSMTMAASHGGKPVNIHGDVMAVNFMVDGKEMSITRNQDTKNVIDEKYNKTSRPCPPFCIQPSVLAPGVETYAELEVIDAVVAMHSGEPVLVQDSRTPDWHGRGHIPGTVNISFKTLSAKHGANPIEIVEIMTEQFGVTESEGILNFSDAKTLVMYCNGMWCGQSPAAIHTLLGMGYPANKIKWYRGGMQDWEVLGLSTVK